MKADEQATIDLKAAIVGAIDIRLSTLRQSAKSSLQQKDKNAAIIEFQNEFSAFFNELQKETPPEMWEEIRRYVVEERLKLSDELFK